MKKTDDGNLSTLIHLFHLTGIRLNSFFLPSFFSIIAGLSEGATLAVLMPLCRGLVAADYSFTKTHFISNKLPFFSWITNLPEKQIFVTLVFLVFIFATSKAVFEYLASFLVSRTIKRFINKLRKVLFERFLSFGKFYFDQNSLGVIHQTLIGHTMRLGYDIKSYQMAFTQVVQLVIYFAAMLWISWQLTIAALIMFPLTHYSSAWLIKKVKNTSLDYSKAFEELSKNTFNTIASILLVKSYRAEPYEQERFSKISQKVEGLDIALEKKGGLLAPLQESLFLFVLLFLIAAITVLIHYKIVSEFSRFLVFFYVLRRASNGFKSLISVYAAYASSVGVLKSLRSVMIEGSEYVLPDGKISMSDFKNSIEVNHLNFGYPTRPGVLLDCSMTIKKGQMVAFVGETGAGKTTMASLLCRFYEAPKGAIFFDETDIRDLSAESFYSKVSIVSQEAQLMNDTLRYNLLYGLKGREVTDREIVDALKGAHLTDLMSRLPEKLDTVIGDRGVKLSGGERQRLSIARALLKNTPILFLDEATSALDSQTEKLVQASIDEAVKGRTTIVIAHRLSTIKHADQIIVFEHGKIIEMGSINELLQNHGKFCSLWEAQQFSH